MAKRHPSLVPLSHDHHHGLALALRCRKHALGQLNPGDHTSLEACAAEVRRFFEDSLEKHFAAEEKFLFKLLAGYTECRPLVAELDQQHQQFRAQMSAHEEPRDLRKFLFDFGDLLEQHIRREERELFPRFEQLVAADEAERVGAAIRHALELDSGDG